LFIFTYLSKLWNFPNRQFVYFWRHSLSFTNQQKFKQLRSTYLCICNTLKHCKSRRWLLNFFNFLLAFKSDLSDWSCYFAIRDVWGRFFKILGQLELRQSSVTTFSQLWKCHPLSCDGALTELWLT
jgi:hypothetical protein